MWFFVPIWMVSGFYFTKVPRKEIYPQPNLKPLRYLKYVILLFSLYFSDAYNELYRNGRPVLLQIYLSSGCFRGCYTVIYWKCCYPFCAGKAFFIQVYDFNCSDCTKYLFYRPFCKWICPLGAIYSLFNKVSLLKITVDSNKCVGCGQCSKACKMDVDVCKTPDHPECIRCGACIKACPKDAICYRFMGKACQKNDNR